MLFAVSILSAVLLLLMLVQIVWANQFVNLYRNSHRPQKDIQYPHVGVIMSLRGADPFHFLPLIYVQSPAFDLCWSHFLTAER